MAENGIADTADTGRIDPTFRRTRSARPPARLGHDLDPFGNIHGGHGP